MQLSTFDKAIRSKQNLPQGKQTLSKLVNNTDDLKLDKFLTEISVSEALHCSLIEFTMHWTDGSKKEVTSELKKKRYSTYWVAILCRMHTQEVSTAQIEC
jgi:hypothetical protein